jgi:hypothetical protein
MWRVAALCVLASACSSRAASDRQPPDGRSSDAPSVDTKSVDFASAEAATVDAPSADATSVDATSVDATPVDVTSVDGRVADGGRRALTRGMWDWKGTDATDPTAEQALLTFATGHGIDTVYLESQTLLTTEPAALRAFVATAAQKGVSVELLFGDPSWALTANQSTAVGLATMAAAFVAADAGGPEPIALQFDVEPYALAGWSTDLNGVANQYLDLLAALAAAKGPALRLYMDVPFWFATTTVTRSCMSRPLIDWVLDTVDGCVIMDYRNTTAGGNGLIALAQPTVTYADGASKSVVIGVETLCTVPANETFCGLGMGALDAQLALVRTAFANDSSLVGDAIHDYPAYAALGP